MADAFNLAMGSGMRRDTDAVEDGRDGAEGEDPCLAFLFGEDQ